MQEEVLEKLKTIRFLCPICNHTISMKVSAAAVLQKKEGLVAFSVGHCEHIIIAHVDQNFKVRSVEKAIDSAKLTPYKEKEEISLLDRIYPSIEGDSSKEECIFYFCNQECEEDIPKVPNLIEKMMLKVIHETKGVNLRSLKENIAKIEKAYNMSFSYLQLEKLLDKYVASELIIKEVFE